VASEKPYSRDEYRNALIANALLDPFNVVLLAVMCIAAILISPILWPVAAVAYLGGAARTFFDDDAATKVLERERAKHKGELQAAKPRLDEAKLTPGIAKLVREAREKEHRIREAIEQAELPYDEVAVEVDAFVIAMEDTARRAQSLADALRDTPPQRVQERYLQVKDDPSKAELADALNTQRTTLERMQKQLGVFGDQMERILVEMDTIRSQIVSMSASTGAAKGSELAGEVRNLREQMGAVAEGMAAAYEGEA
jgi:hypothetical protein